MIELYNLGLTDIEIKNILELCPEILELTKEEISNNIELLINIGCNERHIKDIIISNPFYLNRTIDDITNLINKLLEMGITNINILFNSNPFILNKNSYEIDEFINTQKSKGKNIDDIIDEFESNSYIIDEI